MGLAIVVVLGTDVFLATHWNTTTPVTLDNTVEQFRASAEPVTTTTAVPTATTTAAAGAPSPAVSTTTTAARRPAAPTSARPSGPAAGAPAAFVPPAPGVYTYATTGYEKVSFGGARHDYPKQSFSTVRQQSGCQWESEHRFVEEHTETTRHCSKAGVLEFLSDTVQVSFFGQRQTRTSRCDPPEKTVQIGDAVGARRQYACTIEGGTTQLMVTYLGRETVAVAGTPVETFHVLAEGRQSGEAEGTSRFEAWVHPLTGLSVREVVDVRTRSQAFGTTVDYVEEVSYTLERLTPRT